MPTRVQAYKFRLYAVSRETESLFWQHAGACRWIWNELLAFHAERREAGKKMFGFAAACRILTAARAHPKTAWLNDMSRPALSRAIRDQYVAWQRFFSKQSGAPAFKKKGQHDAFGWSGEKLCRLDQATGRIKVPKIGWLFYRNSRHIEGVVKNVTISRRGKHWYVSMQTTREVPKVKSRSWHRKHQRIGIDMGIACHAAFSTGEMRQGPQPFKQAMARLARQQRHLARKKKGSNRWKKQLQVIRRIHERIANIRNNHLHQLSAEISKNHGLVAIEDLRVKNMSKSVKGTKDAPGVNVRAKSGLNRAILDQGWFELRRQLTYKQAWSGGTLVVVPARNTSRTCSVCAHTDKANRPSQAVFICGGCGMALHADANAAKNILAAGVAVSARGGLVDGQPKSRTLRTA